MLAPDGKPAGAFAAALMLPIPGLDRTLPDQYMTFADWARTNVGSHCILQSSRAGLKVSDAVTRMHAGKSRRC